MRRLFAIACACAGLACNVDASGKPLTEEECGQLIDKIHETFAAGLSGQDRANLDADRNREQSVAECVSDPSWSRAGFQCAMKADSQAALQLCIMKN